MVTHGTCAIHSLRWSNVNATDVVHAHTITPTISRLQKVLYCLLEGGRVRREESAQSAWRAAERRKTWSRGRERSQRCQTTLIQRRTPSQVEQPRSGTSLARCMRRQTRTTLCSPLWNRHSPLHVLPSAPPIITSRAPCRPPAPASSSSPLPASLSPSLPSTPSFSAPLASAAALHT